MSRVAGFSPAPRMAFSKLSNKLEGGGSVCELVCFACRQPTFGIPLLMQLRRLFRLRDVPYCDHHLAVFECAVTVNKTYTVLAAVDGTKSGARLDSTCLLSTNAFSASISDGSAL